MTDRLRDALDRRARSFHPSADPLDHVLDRARRRQRSRRVGTAFLALALFALAGAGAWLGFRPGSPPQPADQRLTVDLGGSVTDVAVGEGSVWASVDTTPEDDDDLSGSIVRIDPDTGEVLASVPLDEVGALAVGEGAVWATNLRARTVTRIDPTTNEVTEVIDLPDLSFEVAEGDAAFLPNDIAVGSGRVWVTTARGGVDSIDPATGEVVTENAERGAIFGGVTVGAGAVWVVADTGPPAVRRVDPVTGQLDSSIDAPAPVTSISADDRYLWVSYEPRQGAPFGSGDVTPQAYALERYEPSTGSNAVSDHWPKVAGGLAAADGIAYLLDLGGNVWLIEDRGARVIGRVDGATAVAANGPDGAWAGAASSVVWMPSVGTASPQPTPTEEPTPDETGTPEPTTTTPIVPEGACAFPAYFPGYLPWVGNTDVVRMTGPDMSRTFDGGGPQGLDPGYSMLSWSAAEGGYGVTLWRATQSAGDLGADLDAPPLPDGSTGSFYLSEGGEDIAIIWNDAIGETHEDECGETTLVVGWSGATEAELRAEAARVAESLEPYDWEAKWPPSSDDGAFAVWPVDIPEEAAADQVGFVDPEILALTFGDDVLGWHGCRIVTGREVETLPGQPPVRHMLYEVERAAQGPTVEVEVAELLPGQWFVTAVYGTQATATVTREGAGWTLEVAWDGPDDGGQPVEVLVGYGSSDEIVRSVTNDGTGTGSIAVDLVGMETNVPGHVVVLFYEASGQPYVAQAFALPPGEATVSAP